MRTGSYKLRELAQLAPERREALLVKCLSGSKMQELRDKLWPWSIAASAAPPLALGGCVMLQSGSESSAVLAGLATAALAVALFQLLASRLRTRLLRELIAAELRNHQER